MKIDLKITTGVAAALMLAACNREPDNGWTTTDRDTAICTDSSGKRVPDNNCQQRSAYGGGGSNAFLWYYLARNSAVPYYGDRAAGGTYARSAGTSYFRAPAASLMSRSTAISRGGFGASAHSFGGSGE